jgi:hypothetical protein
MGSLTGNDNQGNTTRVVGLLELLAKRHLKATKKPYVSLTAKSKLPSATDRVQNWAHNEVEFRNITETGEVVTGPLANDQI